MWWGAPNPCAAGRAGVCGAPPVHPAALYMGARTRACLPCCFAGAYDVWGPPPLRPYCAQIGTSAHLGLCGLLLAGVSNQPPLTARGCGCSGGGPV